jgi:hypothetical protein
MGCVGSVSSLGVVGTTLNKFSASDPHDAATGTGVASTCAKALVFLISRFMNMAHLDSCLYH